MFLGIFLGIVVSIGFIWLLPILPRPIKAHRIGIIGQFSKAQMPLAIRSKISQGLTVSMPDGSAAPLISDKWVESNDGKEYTFFLKDNLLWHDGTVLTSKDLEYNFSDVEVIKKDDKTILFKLSSSKSFAPFPLLLSQPVFKKNFIGLGEYTVKQISESNGVVRMIQLEKDDSILIYKSYPTLSMAKMAFMMGEIDELHDIQSDIFEREPDWRASVDISTTDKHNSHIALFFNMEHDLFKDNKGLRQALAYATRKPKDETRATGPISKTSWAYNPEVKLYDFEPKRANELAEKSFGNIDKVREMTLKISTTNSLLPTAEEIKKDWEEVFQCNVEVEVINAIDPNYQILLTAQEIPTDPDQYSLWHSTQEWPNNIVNLKNLRIDKLLEEGRTALDTKTRKEYYYDFQKYFVEELPALFLYYPKSYSIVRKNSIKNAALELLQTGVRKSDNSSVDVSPQ